MGSYIDQGPGLSWADHVSFYSGPKWVVGQDALWFLVLRILWKPNITVRITQTVALEDTGLGQEPPGDDPCLVDARLWPQSCSCAKLTHLPKKDWGEGY